MSPHKQRCDEKGYYIMKLSGGEQGSFQPGLKIALDSEKADWFGNERDWCQRLEAEESFGKDEMFCLDRGEFHEYRHVSERTQQTLSSHPKEKK